jgi:hypothetical protein
MQVHRRSSRLAFSIVLAAVVLAATMLTADRVTAQGNPAFWLINQSSESIYYLYVTRTNQTNWGDDLLGSDVITVGERYAVRPAAGSCQFDLRVVYSGGESEERRNINLCDISELVFTGPGSDNRTTSSSADFDLVNDSSQTIYRLFVSSVSADNWGEDRLGTNTLSPGRRFEVDLPADGQCRYDIKVEYADDRVEERRNLNLCELFEVAFDGSRAAAPGGGATAPNPDFDVVNRSRQTIYYLYVSPVANDNWGEDRLPGNTIRAGARFKVVLPRNGDCRFDVKVVYEDESFEERLDQNVCNVSEMAFTGDDRRSPPRDTRRDPAPSPDADDVDLTGTGFFVTAQGLALTNDHVAGGCRSITARMDGQPPMRAELVRRDEGNDLALIRVQAPGAVAFATFRAAPGVRAGDDVMVAGFPLASVLQNGLNVTRGNVSAMAGIGGDRSLIQITAPVQPGNSGGPLLDMGANVIGVVVAKLDAENVNFAIQQSVARAFLESNGVRVSERPTAAPMVPGDVSDRANAFTFLIECRE